MAAFFLCCVIASAIGLAMMLVSLLVQERWPEASWAMISNGTLLFVAPVLMLIAFTALTAAFQGLAA